tara:strand:- start:195 stop:455 length:261 start_codon:yes stop_codon:yes gene_type:complete
MDQEREIYINQLLKQISQLQFELKAADKDNERLTKENYQNSCNLEIANDVIQQKETELKELKEGIEKIKALKIVEVQEITDTLLTK